MATFNTTYNYNQPNMNFGKAMLYGAFGSLTGGMGGCMGMGMGMGMNGSIFSMMPGMGMMGMGGFGGYGMMGCYSDSMLGAQIGNIFSGCLMAGIGQLFEGRGANNDGESLSSKISTVQSNANKHLDILNENGNTYSLDNNDFKYAKVEDSYDAEIKSAESAISQKLTSLNKDLLNLGEKPTSVELNEGETTDSSTYKTRLAEAQTKWQEAKAKIDAEIKVLTEKTDTSNDLVKKLVNAKEAKSIRESEIKNAIDALKPLKSEYDELIAEQKQIQEAKIYDDADGNWLNRASKSSVEKYEGGECTKSQVRKAFNLFIEAKKSGKTEEASNWANKIQTMHNSNKDLFDNNYATAYKQVKEWLSNN